MSTGMTGSYVTEFAPIRRVEKDTDPAVAHLEISNRDGGCASPRVPLLTDEMTRHPARFPSTDGSSYVC